MKTLKNFNLPYGIALFLFSLAFVFFLSGCEKQEPLNPHTQSASTADEARQIKSSGASDEVIKTNPAVADAQNVQAFPKFCFPFTAIKIEHYATRLSKAEWSVTITSAGLVTFEGKRNCAYHGSVSRNIDPLTWSIVDALYNQSRFNSMVDVLQTSSRVPVYATTVFKNDFRSGKTVTDFDDGYPASLVYFRTKVVSLLNISKYIGTEDLAFDVKSVQLL